MFTKITMKMKLKILGASKSRIQKNCIASGASLAEESSETFEESSKKIVSRCFASTSARKFTATKSSMSSTIV